MFIMTDLYLDFLYFCLFDEPDILFVVTKKKVAKFASEKDRILE
jgi:hypothetical protein